MKKNVKVTVNGQLFEVEIDDINNSPLNVVVNGKSYVVTLESEHELPVQAVTPAMPATTTIQKISTPAPMSEPQTAGSPNEIRAPMPGKISDISVRVGDKVAYKQQLCTLEAMKMKNAIRAGKAGVITSIQVTDGEKVPYGQVMFVLDPSNQTD